MTAIHIAYFFNDMFEGNNSQNFSSLTLTFQNHFATFSSSSCERTLPTRCFGGIKFVVSPRVVTSCGLVELTTGKGFE